ncbi:MAG: hypothetical protein D6B27_11065 [Gammaproteobacteria bacterium]|nr:MAG: hypothetical protein D6B27_11065 [Gammaproteobacteria bacterium]
MKFIKTFLLTFLLVALYACNQVRDDVVVIKITPEVYSDLYPAVWLRTSDLSISPIEFKNSRPTGEKYEIWIEPDDPEIMANRNSADGIKGFSLVGKDKDAFDNYKQPDSLRFTGRLSRSEIRSGSVYLYENARGKFLMFVESVSKKESTMILHWKKVQSKK